ncbi:MAG: pkd domain containing protein [Bacteroidetes bacterium]|nr:MAG: pkd domain containing protein [Bacteroidota bacterium]
MKKLYAAGFVLAAFFSAQAQVTVTNAIVPQYMQGQTPTNNDRIPMYFWAELSGLTPGATYRYYTSMDSLNSSPTSNGAGNAYLVNATSGTFRRATGQSLSNVAQYDSLVAGNTGNYAGLFAVEPTGNGRFVPGMQLHPQIQLNNGSGGTSVATRVKLASYMVTILAFGTTASANECSAIYDSASTFLVQPKMAVFLYDNNSGTGRPLSSAIVEMEGINQNVLTSIETFYRDLVDTFPQRWGTIMPNVNANGVQTVEYRDYVTGAIVTSFNDNNGLWCSGANTVNPANGTTALYLDENFSLQGTATIPDTAYTAMGTSFSVSSNGPPGTQYSWDFGDGSPVDTNQNPTYTYTIPGTYIVTVIIQAPSCGISFSDTIVVLLGTGISSAAPGSGFSISPNPSDGFFNLHLDGNTMCTISIVNLLGETVYETRSAEHNLRLDLGGKAKGLYMVRVSDDSGRSAIGRVVIK